MIMPIIYSERCNGCGICVTVCLSQVLVLNGNVVSFIAETPECSYCTQCEVVCPTGAILCPYEIVIASTIDGSTSYAQEEHHIT